MRNCLGQFFRRLKKYPTPSLARIAAWRQLKTPALFQQQVLVLEGKRMTNDCIFSTNYNGQRHILSQPKFCDSRGVFKTHPNVNRKCSILRSLIVFMLQDFTGNVQASIITVSGKSLPVWPYRLYAIQSLAPPVSWRSPSRLGYHTQSAGW